MEGEFQESKDQLSFKNILTNELRINCVSNGLFGVADDFAILSWLSAILRFQGGGSTLLCYTQ